MEMEWFAPVARLLEAHPVVGLLAGGTLRPASPLPRFDLSLMELYLAFHGTGRLLRFSSVEEYSWLGLAVTEAVEPRAAAGGETFAACAVGRLRLRHPDAPRAVTALRLVGDPATLAERGLAACAAVELEEGELLFLDPVNLYGIAPGDLAAYERWIAEQVPWRRGWMEPGRVLEEWVWRPGAETLVRERTF